MLSKPQQKKKVKDKEVKEREERGTGKERKENDSFEGVASGRLAMFQWMAPYICVCGQY